MSMRYNLATKYNCILFRYNWDTSLYLIDILFSLIAFPYFFFFFFFSDTIQKAIQNAYGPLHRFCLFVFNVELDQITLSSESFNGATLLTTVSSNFSTGPSLLNKICLQHLNYHIILRFLNSRLNGQTPLMTFPLILQKLILNIISLENEIHFLTLLIVSVPNSLYHW